MTHEELVEKVARAIVEATSGPFDLISEEGKEAARHEAFVAVSVIAEALAEQTEEMDRSGGTMDRHYWPGNRVEHWSAMLAASPLYPEKNDD